MTIAKILPKVFLFGVVGSVIFAAASNNPNKFSFPDKEEYALAPPDTTEEGVDLQYPIKDRTTEFYTGGNENPFDLDDPSVIEKTIEYDPVTGEYVVREKVGEFDYRDPQKISFEDFMQEEFRRSNTEYFRQRAEGVNLLQRQEGIQLAGENELVDRLFGGSNVEIRPKGNIELIFGGSFQNIENPTLPEQARRQGGFEFDMNINMSVLAKIGEKLKLTTNYNTQATFDFENQVKLEYTGYEDEIIQSIEAGNVSFPLSTQLITGSQSLFGIKSEWKFGRLTYTNILSQQESRRENITIEGGAQTQEFEISIDEYDENRHFFLGHYFRENYEKFLETAPVINSPVNITKVEVWVTNTSGVTENTRDIVGFMDLGENDRIHNSLITPKGNESIPTNGANILYEQLINTSGTRDLKSAISAIQNGTGLDLKPITSFEKTRAKKLSETQYTLFPQLGFISLNQSLKPDEVLSVAYEFTYQGKTYKVGEFSEDAPIYGDKDPTVLFLKMLKSTSARPKLPIWDLMMKNIYSLGAYQVSPEDFRLDIYYRDPGGGKKRYIPQGSVRGTPVLQLVNLDRLNNQLDPQPDGVFDFVPGLTINPNNGRVIFPVVEPFGDHLREQFDDQQVASKFVFDILYDSTKTIAQQFPQYNRYTIEGRYKSSVSSEISLGAFNLPKNSVSVTAGGRRLVEGQDYTVDYNLGRVKIINEGVLNSGVPINVNFENNALFGFNKKTMIGNRFDYWINDDFTLGATHMRLAERPYTQKVNFGDDPITNNIYGADVNYNTELPGLTRLLDRLPVYNTTETSALSVSAEAAYFDPGHNNAIDGDNNEGVVYIDDFEGSESSYDLKFPFTAWAIASTPVGAIDQQGRELFPEGDFYNDHRYNYNRAKLVWYALDPVWQSNNSAVPDYIRENPDTRSNHYVRRIDEQEIFEKDEVNPLQTRIATFDLAYWPEERGPYNYEYSPNGSKVSAGLGFDGKLKMPETRYGGIMRALDINDFEAANVEFIEFWVMDPFKTDTFAKTGELYINLGNVSEDILKDSRKFFENGLPRPGVQANLDTTIWGLIPTTQAITNAFDTDPDVLLAQDVGYDGLSSEDERDFDSIQVFLQRLQAEVTAGNLSQAVYDQLLADPSSDDFLDYLDESLENSTLGIIERYKKFAGPEGNTAAGVEEDVYTHGSNVPDSEDLNKDNTLNETEEYFQYRVNMNENMTVDNHPFITDIVKYTAEFPNGDTSTVNWYHFKIPIENYDRKVGGIQDFKSIRFVRMFLTGFDNPVVMRFARLELVRNQWRRYKFSLKDPGEYIPPDDPNTTFFNVSAVSVEENSNKEPIPYALPPGVDQEEFIANSGAMNPYRQNEQSLQMEVCGLEEGDSRAIYKTLNFDFRNYDRLEMFLHAESYTGNQGTAQDLKDGEMYAFIRLGADFTENYYEYAIPLEVTEPNSVPGGSLNNLDVREAIWPDANRMNILLDSLILAKKERNELGINPTEPFTLDVGNGQTITIIGNPDLGNVKVAMIGLRNPKDEGEVLGRSLCGEVWVNELRLNGLNEDGGMAGVARADLKLADLGNVTLSVGGHTVGFGQLEQKVNERFRDNFFQYDAATNLELGKLLPEKFGLRIPMYAGISRSYSRPEYDPYDYDIKLNEKLEMLGDTVDRQEYLSMVQDFSSIKSLNFTNVRKERTGKGKQKFYDISNFNFTYAYTENFHSSPIIAHDLIERHRGGLAYNFSTNPNYIEPLKKVINPQSKFLRPLRDLNFNLMPNKYSFRTDLNRQYGELVMRDIHGDAVIDTSYNKYFTWDRFYDVQWDLTKSLKLDFAAVNNARIDEPNGKIDTKEERDSILQNLSDFGRTVHYNHNLNASYTLPLNKFPLTDWINMRASYGANYDWLAAPINLDTLGNTISNSQNIRLNGDLNFRSLYNKIGFIRKASAPARPQAQRPNRQGNKETNNGEGEKQEEEEEEWEPGTVVRGIVGLVTSLKRVSVNYNENSSTVLPGYMPETNVLGMNPGFTAPGIEFLTGMQPDSNWLNEAGRNGWITTSEHLNNQLMQSYTNNFDIRANLEPFRDMRIDINWKRTYTENFSEYFRFNDDINGYEHLNPREDGSYTISYMALNTIFDGVDTLTDMSETFKVFEDFRVEISEILGELNPYSQDNEFIEYNATDTLYFPEYREGYGPYSQEVLIPAFIAAYTGKDPGEVNTNILNAIPKPNWRFSYNGLSKIKPLDRIFTNFNITHGYNSTLSIGTFTSDFNYHDPQRYGFPQSKDTLSGNFYGFHNIPQIMISEQFAPLIGIDMTFTNTLSASFEYRKSRNVALSLVDYQLIETKSTEFTIGAGYRLKGLTLPFKIGGRERRLDNDLNFKFDFSLRDDKTLNYRLDQNTAEPTRGSLTYSIAPSVDYVVNDRLNVRLFFDRKKTIPATSASYPRSNTNAGIAVRFTLTE